MNALAPMICVGYRPVNENRDRDVELYRDIERRANDRGNLAVTNSSLEAIIEIGSAQTEFILVDGKEVGIIAIRHMDHDEHFVDTLALVPGYTGRGIGPHVLHDKLTPLRNAGCIGLYVHPHNAGARKAYRRFGFRNVERVQTDFGPRILMRWIVR